MSKDGAKDADGMGAAGHAGASLGRGKVSAMTFVRRYSESGVPFVGKTVMKCNAAMTPAGIGGQIKADICGVEWN